MLLLKELKMCSLKRLSFLLKYLKKSINNEKFIGGRIVWYLKHLPVK